MEAERDYRIIYNIIIVVILLREFKYKFQFFNEFLYDYKFEELSPNLLKLAFRDYQSSRKFFHVILRLRPSVIVTRDCKCRFVSL